MEMRTCADYVKASKAKLGDATMSDRALGAHFGLSSSSISDARYGNMSNPVAMKIADLLGCERGELLLVAQAERERNPEVREALLAYAGKVLRLVPSNAAKAGAVLAVALGAVSVPSPAEARVASHSQVSVYYVNRRRMTACNEAQFTRAA